VKILSILNVSNRERLGADSGVIFHRLLFERLARKGAECVVAAPVDLGLLNVRWAAFEPGSSKYDVRFRFDWDAASRLILAEKPDLLFVHQVEQTSHFRALLVTLRLPTRLITYCHYWPVIQIGEGSLVWDASLDHAGLAQIILLRILTAVLASDNFFVTSAYAQSLLLRSSRHYNINVPVERVVILPCPADPEFIAAKPRSFNATNRILYSHRLYQQYGTEFFIDIAGHYERSPIKFVVTDFFGERNAERTALDAFVDQYRTTLRSMSNVIVRTDGHDRKKYREIVESVDIGLAPYRPNANWSMSAVDCMGLGIPVVAPNVASFPEFVPRELLFSSRDEAIVLLDRLLSDRDFWAHCSVRSAEYAKRFVADTACKHFLEIVGGASG
jgi:glycosyltransferase involved in cell wall biosynthesis